MADPRKLSAAILETLLATYPENDPRARARRFSHLYTNIGLWVAGGLIVLGAVAILTFMGSLGATNLTQSIAMMIYGLVAFPLMFIITWIVAKNLNSATIIFLKIKDRLTSLKF